MSISMKTNHYKCCDGQQVMQVMSALPTSFSGVSTELRTRTKKVKLLR